MKNSLVSACLAVALLAPVTTCYQWATVNTPWGLRWEQFAEPCIAGPYGRLVPAGTIPGFVPDRRGPATYALQRTLGIGPVWPAQ